MGPKPQPLDTLRQPKLLVLHQFLHDGLSRLTEIDELAVANPSQVGRDRFPPDSGLGTGFPQDT